MRKFFKSKITLYSVFADNCVLQTQMLCMTWDPIISQKLPHPQIRCGIFLLDTDTYFTYIHTKIVITLFLYFSNRSSHILMNCQFGLKKIES